MVIQPGRRVLTLDSSILISRRAVAAGAPPANWWPVAGKTTAAAYRAKGVASYAASLTNLANPGTNDATEGVAPSWAGATGWTFNGSTQHLLTGLSPTSDATWSALVRFSGAQIGRAHV